MKDPLPDLISAIGKPEFAECLLSAAAERLSHEASALMVFHPAAPPAVLADRLKSAERGHLYGDYLSGVYLLSPFYRATQGLKHPRVARARAIAPKGFAQSEYYRRYFALIGVEDMMGVLIPAGANETAFLSFSRSAGRFTRSDEQKMESRLPILAAAVARHVELAGPLASRHIAAAASFPHRHDGEKAGLTKREAQVVNLILEGHSSRAISEELKISNETVRVHRRNIYDKLGISSQGELFRWFLSAHR
jgi:DNA-binding CsgD family transcriptional regulator